MASHFLSAALRASATSRQHPSPQRQNTFVTLFYRQEKGTKGSPARNVNSPAACFWRIISAALSLSRCISEPVLELPFFCRRRKVSRRLTGSTRSFARWGWRGYAGIPTHQQPSSQISTKRCFSGDRTFWSGRVEPDHPFERGRKTGIRIPWQPASSSWPHGPCPSDSRAPSQKFSEALDGYRKRLGGRFYPRTSKGQASVDRRAQGAWWGIRDRSLGMESPGTAYWLLMPARGWGLCCLRRDSEVPSRG